ncbi:hypothetical protein MDAP_002025 [Mitosporidium daphniae]
MIPKGSASLNPEMSSPINEESVQTIEAGEASAALAATSDKHWNEKPQREGCCLGRLIGNRFKVVAKIGAGAFGTIFSGTDIVTSSPIAIKIEPKAIKVRQLAYEAHVYREIQGVACMPRIYAFFEEEAEGDSSLVMELLGPSLEELFNRSSRLFALPIVLILADQMIQRIESLHSRYFLHRDIKPDNFVVGRTTDPSDSVTIDGNTCVYLIDFGLAKAYRRPGSAHIPFRDGKHLTGTARYASLNAHRGYEQSRRDDLESLGYVLIYFLRGSLPWQGLGRPKKPPPGTRPSEPSLNAKYARISECKKAVSVAELTQGLPPEFAAFFTHIRGLRFEERPDYEYLRKLFRAVARREALEKGGESIREAMEKRKKPLEDSLSSPLKILGGGSASSLVTIPPNSSTLGIKEYVPCDDGCTNERPSYHPRLGLPETLPINLTISAPRIIVKETSNNYYPTPHHHNHHTGLYHHQQSRKKDSCN